MIISGYASVFNITDEHNDMITPGAFTTTLSTNRKPVFLWQHMVDKPIGVVEYIQEDRHGLYIQAKILTNVRCGQEAVSLIEANAIYGLSIGFNPTSYWISDSGIRIIEEVDLWEVSLVTFPANSSSVVTELKGQDIQLSQIDKYLDEAIAILSL
jgi:HK97 family phage prohead protease